MHHRMTHLLLLTTIVLPLAAVGCKGGKTKITPDATAAPAVPSAPGETTRPPAQEVKDGGFEGREMGEDDIDKGDMAAGDLQGSLRTVYFAFDSYELTPSSVATLRQNADALKSNPAAKIVIEGHADERGSIEYNIALSDKRANAVRDYLASLGIDRGRLRVLPYGEERPAEPGHSEAAWSKNRRAEFLQER